MEFLLKRLLSSDCIIIYSSKVIAKLNGTKLKTFKFHNCNICVGCREYTNCKCLISILESICVSNGWHALPFSFLFLPNFLQQSIKEKMQGGKTSMLLVPSDIELPLSFFFPPHFKWCWLKMTAYLVIFLE